MDSYEATKIVFSRIQSLDSENASKIMGYLLIQDKGDKEIIRLAFGPDTLLHNVILNAKTQLGLLLLHNPTISKPNLISRSLSSSSRSSNNGFDPSSPSSSNIWSLSNPISPSSTCSPSYANIVSKSTNSASAFSSLSSSINSNSAPCASELGPDNFQFKNNHDDLFEGSPESVYKQSYFGHEDVNSAELGWKPCSYFARGFCKNGNGCRFLHKDDNVNVLEQCHEDFLRSNASQQHKLAPISHFMSNAGATSPYNKGLSFLMDQQIDIQRSAATAALMMGEEFHKFGRYQNERNDISSLGGNVIPSSRQIYLTFPADSTFREEDVSNYFNMFGPVQDVRIPYQQKRMFGFVTFVYSETVRIILAKGNSHYVCDSRVLVKPYKEKGNLPDRKLHQHLERGDYPLCLSPTGLDSRELCDFSLGSRMFYSPQEMLLRRKLEDQANLEQAIELQERRLMNMQLRGIKNNSHHHHQYYRGLSEMSPFPSISTFSHSPKNHPFTVLPNGTEDASDVSVFSQTCVLDAEQQEEKESHKSHNQSTAEVCHLHESSMEKILPDNLIASPAEAGDHIDVLSTTSAQLNESTSAIVTTISSSNSNSNTNNLLPTTSNSTANATSPKSVLSNCPGFVLSMEPLECN